MLLIALLIIAACVLAIRASGSTPSGRAVAVVGYSVLVFLGAQLLWTILLLVGVVPLDEIFRSFGLFSDVVLRWYRVIAVVPPLLAAFVFAIVFWRRSAPQRGRGIEM